FGRAVPTHLRIRAWHGRRSARPDWRDQIDAGRPRPSSVGHSHETEIAMTPATTLVLAFSMSLDAFAAALSKAAALKRGRLFDAFRTGIILGVIEAITPAVGWAFGFALSIWISEIDHWVAFILLSLIGGRMAFHALRRVGAGPTATQHSLALLVLTA